MDGWVGLLRVDRYDGLGQQSFLTSVRILDYSRFDHFERRSVIMITRSHVSCSMQRKGSPGSESRCLFTLFHFTTNSTTSNSIIYNPNLRHIRNPKK